MRALAWAALLVTATAISGCAGAPGIAEPRKDAKLVEGPPIVDITTPFDHALSCLKGKIQPSITFGVGAIIDQTGKEQLTDGGAGKFVTQGAGDIVQSALFRAGATVLNRRDPRVIMTEVQWKIRDPRTLVPVNFYITGSINSLDFIPGGGFDVSIAGVGPRYRQNRILVGLDLALTEAATGRIVANVPLQKQIFASEAGFGIGRFFDDTLVVADIGGSEREAVSFALRQMLNLATFDLLTQVMNPHKYVDCRKLVDQAYGRVENTGTAEAARAIAPAAGETASGAVGEGGTAAGAQPAPMPGPARNDNKQDEEAPAAADGDADDTSVQSYWEDPSTPPSPAAVSTILTR